MEPCKVTWCAALAEKKGDPCTVHGNHPRLKPTAFKDVEEEALINVYEKAYENGFEAGVDSRKGEYER